MAPTVHLTLFTLLVSDGLCLVNGALPYQQSFPYSNENRKWADEAQATLQEKLQQKLNTGKAKNVILFLGDGMSMSTVTASRIYMGQMQGRAGEDEVLSWETFPFSGLSKTYSANHQITDSAAAANAYLCGEKTNYGTVGVNHNVPRTNCSLVAGNELRSILDWSMDEGKATGFVTTSRVTHASPAGLYAHSADRNWEVDSKLPDDVRTGGQCKDISLQLIVDNPGINVILGGGRSSFYPDDTPDVEYSNKNGTRMDGRSLVEEWNAKKEDEGASHSYVWNKEQFDAVDPANTDYLLGLFEPSHMKYTLDASAEDEYKEPTIAEMTQKSIEILKKNDKGYFLFVEGARIDHGHHAGKGRLALADTVAFHEAVQKGMDLTNAKDTLIVVTADHSHTFHMTGYTGRGTNILGVVDPIAEKVEPALDGMPYLTIGYADGPGPVDRTDLSDVDTTGKDYLQPAKVAMNAATHGGEDVPIYAQGPMSHMFSGVVEEHYIAHAMAYASCVGRNKGHCEGKTPGPEPPSCGGSALTTGLLAVTLGFIASKIMW